MWRRGWVLAEKSIGVVLGHLLCDLGELTKAQTEFLLATIICKTKQTGILSDILIVETVDPADEEGAIIHRCLFCSILSGVLEVR